jgi:hypothetical protein
MNSGHRTISSAVGTLIVGILDSFWFCRLGGELACIIPIAKEWECRTAGMMPGYLRQTMPVIGPSLDDYLPAIGRLGHADAKNVN